MVNGTIHMLTEPDGTPVGNAVFDLSHEQIVAVAHAACVARVETHRDEALETDAVLALRELTAICDELDRLAAAEGHGTLVLPLARLNMLHDALLDFSHSRHDAEIVREEDRGPLAIVDGLLDPMQDLRAEGMRTALGAAGSHAVAEPRNYGPG